MKSNYGIRYCVLLAALFTVAGCAAGPEENALLEQARSAYNAARNDPLVMENASLELARAEENLRTAEELWEDDAERVRVDHHAYLARQQTAIARETAQFQKAQQDIANAEAERNRVLLEARSKEAEAARQQAQATQRKLEQARTSAEEQERLARTRELEEARRQAEESAQLAAQLEAELSELKARPTERGMVLTLGEVLFDLDKADLNPGANRIMDRLADFLKNHEERRVLVEGFTDSTGAEDYNMQLSERRARSVSDALTGRGISGDRIEVRGYGEQYPVATNETVAGRQQNRRVEILFSDEKGELPGRR